MGSYRGKASFDAFSHRRTIAATPGGWADRILRTRYMPYRAIELRLMRMATGPRVGFDRDAVSYTHLTLPTICSV